MLCPYCSEEIKDGAKKCRFCWEFLEETSQEEKVAEKKEVKTESKSSPFVIWFRQFFIFFTWLFLFIWLSRNSRIFIILTILLCVWYAFCSKDDWKVLDFKSYIQPERYKNKTRVIIAWILVVIFWLLSLGQWHDAYEKEKAEQEYKIAYEQAPIPAIQVHSSEWELGATDMYKLEATIKNATEVTVNWEPIDIIDWEISRDFTLENPELSIVIFAKNEYKDHSYTVTVSRDMTEEEIEQARIQEEQRIAAEKTAKEEQERLEAEKKALYAEKQKRIDQLKAKCRITYDQFNKINWIESKTFKDTNNQNAIEIYIWKYDDWTLIRRFKIMYAARDWLFIKKYQFSVWGDVIDYIPTKVEKDNYTTIREWSDNSYWATETNIVSKIIANNWWTIRHIWSQYHDDRAISQKEVQALKDMNELYSLLKEKQELWF